MKHPALPILTSLAFLFAPCGEMLFAKDAPSSAAETIVLAKRHFLPAAGTVVTKDLTMAVKDASMKMKAGPQQMDGTMTSMETDKETSETLSQDKVRRILVSKKDTEEVKLNGEVHPSPDKADPLVGLPVILERKGETWVASLENGSDPDPEQLKELNKLAVDAGKEEDFQMYGDSPRKPGDKWNVDPGKAISFGAEDVTGDYSVEFVEIKDFEGVRCAVFKHTFDFKGKTKSAGDEALMEIKVKGEAISRRSIADMIDLDVELKGVVTSSGSPAPNMTMLVEGPMTFTQKTSLKRP